MRTYRVMETRDIWLYETDRLEDARRFAALAERVYANVWIETAGPVDDFEYETTRG